MSAPATTATGYEAYVEAVIPLTSSDPGIAGDLGRTLADAVAVVEDAQGSVKTALTDLADAWRGPAATEFAGYSGQFEPATAALATAFRDAATVLDGVAKAMDYGKRTAMSLNDQVADIYGQVAAQGGPAGADAVNAALSKLYQNGTEVAGQIRQDVSSLLDGATESVNRILAALDAAFGSLRAPGEKATDDGERSLELAEPRDGSSGDEETGSAGKSGEDDETADETADEPGDEGRDEKPADEKTDGEKTDGEAKSGDGAPVSSGGVPGGGPGGTGGGKEGKPGDTSGADSGPGKPGAEHGGSGKPDDGNGGKPGGTGGADSGPGKPGGEHPGSSGPSDDKPSGTSGADSSPTKPNSTSGAPGGADSGPGKPGGEHPGSGGPGGGKPGGGPGEASEPRHETPANEWARTEDQHGARPATETPDRTCTEEGRHSEWVTGQAEHVPDGIRPPQTVAPPAQPPAGTVDTWIDEALTVLRHEGVPADLLDRDDLTALIDQESGGDPRFVDWHAENANHAGPPIGLLQTIQPVFDTYHLPGHTDIYDPVDNIIAGVRYALDNYGSLTPADG